MQNLDRGTFDESEFKEASLDFGGRNAVVIEVNHDAIDRSTKTTLRRSQ